jgi:hypothetical protein
LSGPTALTFPGGVIRTQGEEIRLRTLGRNYTGADFAKIVLLARPDGQVVTLDRVATIRDDFVEDLIESKFNGRPTITIAVLKTSDEDTLAIDARCANGSQSGTRRCPPGFTWTLGRKLGHPKGAHQPAAQERRDEPGDHLHHPAALPGHPPSFWTAWACPSPPAAPWRSCSRLA